MRQFEVVLRGLDGVEGPLTAPREQIAALDKPILAWHRANPCSRRLSGIAGFGPILSSAAALRPAIICFSGPDSSGLNYNYLILILFLARQPQQAL